MKNQKFTSIILSFTPTDWKEYQKFAKALYTESSDLYAIIKYLSARKAKLSEEFLDVAYLQSKIKPSVSTDIFYNSITTLNSHLDEYIIQRQLNKNQLQKDILLLKGYSERGLDRLYKRKRKKLKPIIEGRGQLSLWNNLQKLHLSHFEYFSSISSSLEEAKIILNTAYNSLVSFTKILLGYYSVEMVNREVVLQENWQSELKLIKSIGPVESNINEIFSDLKLLKEKKNEESYEALIKALNSDSLSVELKHTILIHLISYQNHNTKKGNENAAKKVLDLYKFGLEHDILFPSGKTNIRSFLNIVNTACVFGNTEWAKNFVDNYSKCVGIEFEEQTKYLSLAQIYLCEKTPSKTLDLLKDIKFKNFDHELRARIISLFANFDLFKEDFDYMESNYRTFRYFMNKNQKKVDVTTHKATKNLIYFIKKIATSPEPESLRAQIIKEEYVMSKRWLIERINNL